ncbi:MAG TPA: ATP-grasp domain-containing protein, partial [Candidatus Pelagibacter sp.]|nr:ATP-grasp domain-containing protein [Candidatus Pelagibacter sp.]
MFKKILVANRGEIAVRIIRACKELGIATVAVHSDVDTDSMHVRLADESVCIGSHQPQNSYLNISALMSAVDVTGADAIHPGYGFLSENAQFSEIVTKHGIKFIGPSSNLIKKMGDKIEAKKIAKENGLPIIEGSSDNITSVDNAKKIINKIGYPVLIKAAGGGGGKGMKIVNKPEELEKLFSLAKLEAKKYFNNDSVYIEKYFKNSRHIEVQVLSGKNRTVHLYERDCSVQRNHQKLIEETPSP